MMISGANGTSGMQNMQKAQGGPPPPPPTAEMEEELFSSVDSDGDGVLDVDEFSELTSKISNDHGVEIDAEELFSKIDTDGNGALTLDEMKAGREEMQKGMEGLKQMGEMNKPNVDMSKITESQEIDIAQLLNTDTEADMTSLLDYMNSSSTKIKEQQSMFQATV